MARIGVFIPCGSADGANVARATIQDQCAFDDVRIIRLRDRAHVEGVSALEGPRLAAPRSHVTDPQSGDFTLCADGSIVEVSGVDHDGFVRGFVHRTDGGREGMNRVRGYYQSTVYGGRPMTPAEVAAFKADGTRPGKAAVEETVPPTPEQIEAYMLANGDRARYRAIAAAVAEANGLQNDVLAKAVDDLTAERDALLARAEKAEGEVKRCTQDRYANGEALAPFMKSGAAPFVATDAQAIASLVANWQKRGEELEALRKELSIVRWQNEGLRIGEARSTPEETATRDPLTDPREGDWFVDNDGDVYHVTKRDGESVAAVRYSPRIGEQRLDHGITVGNWIATRALHDSRPMTLAEVAAFKANGTRPATPSEAEMAAELREAGWHQGQASGQWYLRPSSEPHTTADAHAAMRAAKGAK